MQEMPVWFLRQEDPLEKGKLPTPVFLGFPGGTDGGKESACNAGDLGLIPELGWSPGERNGNPLQHSRLENSMDRAAWQVTVHGVAKSQTWLSGFHFEQVYSTVKGHPEVLKKHPPGASDQCLLCEASRPCPGLPVSSQGPSGILWTHWCPWCRSVQKLGRDGDSSKSSYKHLLLPFIFGFFPTILINLMLSTIVWGTLGFPSGSGICLQCGKHEFNPWVGIDLLEQGMATHPSTLAWRMPWTEEPGGLQSTWLQRVGHDWVTNSNDTNEEHQIFIPIVGDKVRLQDPEVLAKTLERIKHEPAHSCVLFLMHTSPPQLCKNDCWPQPTHLSFIVHGKVVHIRYIFQLHMIASHGDSNMAWNTSHWVSQDTGKWW